MNWLDWFYNLPTAYGTWFASAQDTEILKHFLSDKMQADMAEWVFKIAIVWVLMGRRVAEWAQTLKSQLQKGLDDALTKFSNHTTAIEGKLTEVVGEMKALKDAVARDLSTHSKQIGELKAGQTELANRVSKLETPK
jgi:hypothetical protein